MAVNTENPTPRKLLELECNRMRDAVDVVSNYDMTRGDGWPYVTVELNGVFRRAEISFFYKRGRILRTFYGEEFIDGLKKLEDLINEQHSHEHYGCDR